MHTPDNQNSHVRTSSAQIDGKAEAESKSRLILDGVMRKYGSTAGTRCLNVGACSDAAFYLCMLIDNLTSASKSIREIAKADVRKLVKVGKEAKAEERIKKMGYSTEELEKDNPYNAWMQEGE